MQPAPVPAAPGALAGGSFDSLWARLQQQHAQEAAAEAARQGQQPGLAQPAQHGAAAGSLSETDFWKQLQGR